MPLVIQKLIKLPESPDANSFARHNIGRQCEILPFNQFENVKPANNVRLLTRDTLMQVLIDTPIRKKIKTLMITGGTSSFGNMVLKRFLDTDIGAIKIFSCAENKQDNMRRYAEVNRPKNPDEFTAGNENFTAELDNPYGRSKLSAEKILRAHSARTVIYRLPNVFGKWCRPNYNSAVATFCFNAARGLPLQVNDPAREMHLVYIDDVIKEFMRVLDGKEPQPIPSYKKKSAGTCRAYSILLEDSRRFVDTRPERRAYKKNLFDVSKLSARRKFFLRAENA